MIRQTSDGGYVFAGVWLVGIDQIYNTSIYKLDGTGNLLWQLTFPNNFNKNGGGVLDVQQTKDGWYVLCGATTDSSLPGYHGNIDSWVVKFGPPLPIISSIQQQAFPLLECSPREFDTVFVHNRGKIPLVITSATFGGAKNYYSVVYPSALPDSIAPGDSGRFIVQFSPQATGTFADTLSLISNDNAPGHSPWKIAFTGEKENAGFTTSSSQIDFGIVKNGTTKDSILTITNTGSIQEIIQIFVSPPFYADSSFVTLVPGQTDTVHVHYSPTQDGTSYGNFCLVIPPPCYDISCVVAVGKTHADTTTSGGSNTALISANGLNAGALICQTLKDTSVTVTTTGTSPVQIDSGAIAGADAAAFQFIGSVFPLVAAPGVQSPIPIRFAPRHVGASKAILILYSHQVANSPDTILLAGVEDSVNITTDYATISFGTALTGITKDTVVIIHNTGVTTETVKLQTAPPFSTDSTSVTILPGDSVAVKVHYLPTKVGSDDGVLTIITNDPCAITQDVALSGNVYPSSGGRADICPVIANPIITVGKGADSATVTLAETIPLPVDSVVFDLGYDAQALSIGPVSSPSCQLKMRRTSLDTIHFTLTTCSSPLPAGALCTTVFAPLVSSRDTSYTQLSINNVRIYPLSDSITGTGCSLPLTVLPL
ncbi:MAG TPA: choice-of-anchor D domain-containing protein, partial [Candidatus Kapabacteria bacterium]|nr:choice-of-anchor D domain-containing protein [Candidatus Kapabacteria bacterium]